MSEKKQTAVEWFYDKIKSHFEHDGDLLETLTFTMAIAKQKEREQIVKAHLHGVIHKFDNPNDASDNYYNDNFGVQ